jgi:hypothetical protein
MGFLRGALQTTSLLLRPSLRLCVRHLICENLRLPRSSPWKDRDGAGRWYWGNLRIYMPLNAKIKVSIKIAKSRKNETFFL